MSCSLQKEQSEKTITYLDDNAGFIYLDEYYAIQNADLLNFDSLKKLYNYAEKDGIPTYRDSLALVLSVKYNGMNPKSNFEILQVFYPWERIYAYLRITKEEGKEVMKDLSLRFKYDIKAYFKDETTKSEIKAKYLERLKKTCYQELPDSVVFRFQNNSDLMDYAFALGAKERFIHSEKGLNYEVDKLDALFNRKIQKAKNKAKKE